jgi:hypothetical protein
MDPRIRIHTKMSWIRNTAFIYLSEVQSDLGYLSLSACDYVHECTVKVLCYNGGLCGTSEGLYSQRIR